MKRYIVLIANIEDGKPSVNCFLFEIENGKQLPVEKSCFKGLDGDSPFRLNSFVMENVRNGAESLNDKDKVCTIAGKISIQGEKEIRQTLEADKRNPEIGLSITPNIHDKHVSAGKKEIDDSGRANKKNTEIDDHDHKNNTNMIKTTEEQHVDNLSAVTERENETNSGAAITEQPKSSNHHTHPSNEVSDIQQPTINDKKQNNNKDNSNNNISTNNHMNNNKSETEHRLQKSNTRTILSSSRSLDGKFVFNTSSKKEENSPTSPSEEQQESNLEEEEITAQPKSTNYQSDLQHDTTNEEKKEPTSPSEKHHELKVPDPSAESVHEGRNDKETENAITGQPKSPDHHRDPQQTNTANGEEKVQTSPSEEHQKSKVNDIHHTTNTNNNNKQNNNNNNSNIITNNDKNNSKIEMEHRLQKSNTRTKLVSTRCQDCPFVFKISSDEKEKETTFTSEEQPESKINNASAGCVHKEGNHPETEEVATGHPRSSNDRIDPQHTTAINEEEKVPSSTSEEPQELKVNDTPAESVHKGGNDPGSEDAISRQPKSPDHHSDPQGTTTTTTNGEENSQISPNEEQQESKVNNASAESVHKEGNDPETEEVSTGQPRPSNDRNAITGQPEASNHNSDPQHTTTTCEEENEEQTKEAKCRNLFCCLIRQRYR